MTAGGEIETSPPIAWRSVIPSEKPAIQAIDGGRELNMAKSTLDEVRLRLVYRGGGPVGWRGGPEAFGVQDKANDLVRGSPGADGSVVFDVSLQIKPEAGTAPVFVGPFAHGPAGERFLYLSWRNPTGEYARRLKLPLGGVAWTDIAAARRADQPLVGDLVDEAKLTTTGAHIGGTRPIVWKPPAS
jgi:Family of unknown function (DUF5990)